MIVRKSNKVQSNFDQTSARKKPGGLPGRNLNQMNFIVSTSSNVSLESLQALIL